MFNEVLLSFGFYYRWLGEKGKFWARQYRDGYKGYLGKLRGIYQEDKVHI